MVFLDNAATSYHKPPAVWNAVRDTMRECASVGRGGYAQSREAARRVFSCREAVCELFGLSEPEKIIFTYNTTIGLNMAIKGLLREGHAVISGYEHNAVLRPVSAMRNVEFTAAASPLFDGEAMLKAFENSIRPGTKLAVCCHVSNVFGSIAPVEEIDALCYRHGIPLVVDAAQSAGVLVPDIRRMKAVQFICMPGHKGLYGPQGTGVMLHIGTEPCDTLIEGGTGSDSADAAQPGYDPDRFESGTHNVPGIAGLEAGVRFVLSRKPANILRHERALGRYIGDELEKLGAEVFMADDPAMQTGVVSFRVSGRNSEEVADALARAGIAVRAGLHCAPLAHKTAGTFPDGTVRVSPGAFNTVRDCEKLIRAVRAII